MDEKEYTIIVPADLIELARYLAAGLSPRGSGMFTTGISATGQNPATEYISAGYIESAIGAVLKDGDMLYGACKAAELEVSIDQCNELVERSDVREEKPFSVMERLGRKLIHEASE